MKLERIKGHDRPVFIDPDGEIVSDREGLTGLRKLNELSRKEFAKMIGKSNRTLDGYENGRKIDLTVLLLLEFLLEEGE